MATKKSIAMPQNKAIGALMCFVKEGDELEQYMHFRKPTKKAGEQVCDFNLPLGKALKGSVIFEKDPTAKDGRHVIQKVRVYKKTKHKHANTFINQFHSSKNKSIKHIHKQSSIAQINCSHVEQVSHT